MKKIIAFFLLINIWLNCPAQKESESIRFVPGGPELKPTGTLVVTVGKCVQPFDNKEDSLWGSCVKTDIKTFNIVKKFLERKNYTTTDSTKLKLTEQNYKIIITNKSNLYITGENIHQFFVDLKIVLFKEKADQAVINAFKYRF